MLRYPTSRSQLLNSSADRVNVSTVHSQIGVCSIEMTFVQRLDVLAGVKLNRSYNQL
jgi:hypothetical protein